MQFEQAFNKLLNHEGDYSDHAADPGGKTRYGITEAVARASGYNGEMRELPLAVAHKIYRAQYWDATRCDELPAAIRYAVFDGAVNSGVGQSVRWLQRALLVADDGRIGPVTIRAAASADHALLLRRVLSQRLRFMTQLSNWHAFSRGWARRIADLMEVA
jgi:lysozyme family protein